MGIHRSALRRRRRSDAADTKLRNGVVKTKERTRRDARMTALIQDGTPPFAPSVMSWLSRKLNKRSSAITSADLQTLKT